jgi:hypothetical protein
VWLLLVTRWHQQHTRWCCQAAAVPEGRSGLGPRCAVLCCRRQQLLLLLLGWGLLVPGQLVTQMCVQQVRAAGLGSRGACGRVGKRHRRHEQGLGAPGLAVVWPEAS